jgi:hypothetical protein
MADSHGTMKVNCQKKGASLGTFAMYRAALRSFLNTHLDTAFLDTVTYPLDMVGSDAKGRHY